MRNKSSRKKVLPPAERGELFQTVAGLPHAGDPLATQLQYVADVVAEIGSLSGPILAWREDKAPVRHVRINLELVVGRQTAVGLSLAGDDLLSRRHFFIRQEGTTCKLEDLASRNGTSVNSSENRIVKHCLCDGDVIYAGRQIFVYLNLTPA